MQLLGSYRQQQGVFPLNFIASYILNRFTENGFVVKWGRFNPWAK